jgi:hypothetical protein
MLCTVFFNVLFDVCFPSLAENRVVICMQIIRQSQTKYLKAEMKSTYVLEDGTRTRGWNTRRDERNFPATSPYRDGVLEDAIELYESAWTYIYCWRICWALYEAHGWMEGAGEMSDEERWESDMQHEMRRQQSWSSEECVHVYWWGDEEYIQYICTWITRPNDMELNMTWCLAYVYELSMPASPRVNSSHVGSV